MALDWKQEMERMVAGFDKTATHRLRNISRLFDMSGRSFNGKFRELFMRMSTDRWVQYIGNSTYIFSGLWAIPDCWVIIVLVSLLFRLSLSISTVEMEQWNRDQDMINERSRRNHLFNPPTQSQSYIEDHSLKGMCSK